MAAAREQPLGEPRPRRPAADGAAPEALLDRRPSVIVVPVDGDDLVLVRQRRPGANEPLLELPAGTIEPGETPGEAAVRELAEECGVRAERWRSLGRFWVAPSYSTQEVHVFEARGLAPVEALADADEAIHVERRPAAALAGLLLEASSLAALLLWQRGGAAGRPQAA
ncbi:MAG: NUDIX hydrolase [Thermoleophilia bacterium]